MRLSTLFTSLSAYQIVQRIGELFWLKHASNEWDHLETIKWDTPIFKWLPHYKSSKAEFDLKLLNNEKHRSAVQQSAFKIVVLSKSISFTIYDLCNCLK